MKGTIGQVLLVAALPAGAVAASGAGASQVRGEDVQYRVTNLPALGGTSSVGFSINNRGWVGGRSNLPGNQSRHATLWRDGRLTDLGTLGGPNSAVLWPVKNVRGIVTGIAQTNELDPLRGTWSCGFFFPAATRTGVRCLGFKCVMTPLAPAIAGSSAGPRTPCTIRPA
jgi:probable HAF family extracellular repeat protein